MKKLEELGISPTPWRTEKLQSGEFQHIYADNYPVALSVKNEDARLTAAAPKLYKALYELVEAYEACNAHDGTCGNCERLKMCQQDEERIIANAKSALAEAAGEGGEDK